jgi:hypothetical protein
MPVLVMFSTEARSVEVLKMYAIVRNMAAVLLQASERCLCADRPVSLFDPVCVTHRSNLYMLMFAI